MSDILPLVFNWILANLIEKPFLIFVLAIDKVPGLRGDFFLELLDPNLIYLATVLGLILLASFGLTAPLAILTIFILLYYRFVKNIQTSAEDHKLLYSYHRDIHQAFSQVGLAYWASSGTLLATQREGKIIPWDDDIDLEIDVKDRKKLFRAVKILEKKGYAMDWNAQFDLYQIFHKDRSRGILWPVGFHYPWVDIFPMKLTKKGYQYSKLARFWFSIVGRKASNLNIAFPKSDVFPRKLTKIGPNKIWIPNKPKNILDKMYGEDWKTVGRYSYSHDHSLFPLIFLEWLSNFDRTVPL